jgi:long-chain acyl-CoA synthetase
MNLAELLARAARVFSENPAIVLGTQVHATYAAFARRAAALAAGFRDELELAPGDRVGLFMSNCPQYLEVLWGAWWAGLAAVPINAKLHPREAEYILEHSGARLCFVTGDLPPPGGGRIATLDRLIDVASSEYRSLATRDAAQAIEPARPDDLAWLFYTSGTTGRPKGVEITHRNLMTMALCYLADVDEVAHDDCVVHAAPMSHGSGIYCVPHVLRAAKQVVPESGGFDAGEIFDLVHAHPGAAMFAAPTMVKRLVDHARSRAPGLDNLKTIIYGGGPMYLADIHDAMSVMGQRFAQIYGQGESPMTITALSKWHHANEAHPFYEARLASVGVAQSAVEVRIAGEDDAPLPPGETGEILVRGDSVMRGYWANPDASAATLAGGWLHTGDVGTLDEDGFLTLKDRSKDLIISGGSNIYPREVEEVLLRHPGVAEVSVVGRAHPEWGEEVIAFVVRAAGASFGEGELDKLCLQHIARFKRPKAYRFVDALPKNNYGKVLKTELRERLARERGDRA